LLQKAKSLQKSILNLLKLRMRTTNCSLWYQKLACNLHVLQVKNCHCLTVGFKETSAWRWE